MEEVLMLFLAFSAQFFLGAPSRFLWEGNDMFAPPQPRSWGGGAAAPPAPSSAALAGRTEAWFELLAPLCR